MTQELIFDREGVMERLGGDIALLGELVEILRVEFPKSLALLQGALKDADSENLHKSAHAIKGALGNVGAARAQAIAYSIELDGRAAKIEKVESLLSDLQDAVEGFYTDFEKFQHSSR